MTANILASLQDHGLVIWPNKLPIIDIEVRRRLLNQQVEFLLQPWQNFVKKLPKPLFPLRFTLAGPHQSPRSASSVSPARSPGSP